MQKIKKTLTFIKINLQKKPLKRILVTGGSGFIGSHLCKLLVNEGYNIRIFDNLFRGKTTNIGSIKDNIEFIQGDITNKNSVENILEDIDTVIHLAAINGTKFFYEIPHKVLSVNIIGTINILNAAINSGVKRFVFSSSSETYGFPKTFPTNENHILQIMDIKNPRFSYSISKIAGESLVINYAKQFGFDYTILRYHNAYGPSMGNEHVITEFIRRVINNEKFTVQGNGSQMRSFCYISDIVKGTFLASIQDKGVNEIFNIGNDEISTINQLINLLEKISGKKIVPNYDTTSEHMIGSTLKRQPDIKKAKELLNYEPQVSIKEGLELTFRWYENYYKNL